MNHAEQQKHTTVTATLRKQVDDLMVMAANDDHRIVHLADAIHAIGSDMESLTARTDVRVTLHTRQLDELETRVASLRGWHIQWATLSVWARLRWLLRGQLD